MFVEQSFGGVGGRVIADADAALSGLVEEVLRGVVGLVDRGGRFGELLRLL